MIKGTKLLSYWHKSYYAFAAIIISLFKALLTYDDNMNKSDGETHDEEEYCNNSNTLNPHLDWRGRDADHPDYRTDKW